MSFTPHPVSNTILSPQSFPAIKDYGIIGNCHTAALISTQGSMDWLCWPRFDSPSLFARILDLERGGAWSIHPTTSFESTHRYLRETNVLETTFVCPQGCIRLLDFMDLASDEAEPYNAVPGRSIRIVEAIAGTVEIASTCAPRLNYAREVPQLVASGTQLSFGSFAVTGPVEWQVERATQTANCRMTLQAGQQVAFTLAAREDEEDMRQPRRSPAEALASTIDFWRRWAARCTYQGPYRDETIRSALVLQLMTYAPTGAIVAAPTTSLPEVLGGERNWDYRFSWLRDASMTLYALLLAGYLDDEQPFFDWIVRTIQWQTDGIKILYPITSEGHPAEQTLDHLRGYCDSRPVRIGNNAVRQVQLDVYGEVMSALHFAWKSYQYDPTEIWQQICPLLDWVADRWREPDCGIWEVRGGLRHFVYSKVMLWVALDCGVEMAEALDLPGNVERWRRDRDEIRAEVFEKGWSEKLGAFKQSYEDETLDAANLLLPVVGFMEGTDPRAISNLDATLKHLVSKGWCYRYRSVPEELNGEEGAFVLCTFWAINALILAGRTAEASAWFEQVLAQSSPLGLFAEEIDPETGTHLGNFPQAFSHIGAINVAVSLAHVGCTGTVLPHHMAAANAAGKGGGGT